MVIVGIVYKPLKATANPQQRAKTIRTTGNSKDLRFTKDITAHVTRYDTSIRYILL